MTHPHHPPDRRRRRHRRRIRRHLLPSTSCTTNSASPRSASTRQMAPAAPGTGTATRARCRTPRATSTATPSTATCCRTAPGRAPTSPSPRSSNTSKASSNASTCAATSASAPRSTSAIYFDDEGQWEVTTDDGAVYRATYVINAVGLLSAINFPNLPGLDTFEGETIHTAAWPEGKDLTGRRVGVIGTGSTGQQVITALAPKVEHLTVFVRTPQYSVPVGNRPVTAAADRRGEGRLRRTSGRRPSVPPSHSASKRAPCRR